MTAASPIISTIRVPYTFDRCILLCISRLRGLATRLCFRQGLLEVEYPYQYRTRCGCAFLIPGPETSDGRTKHRDLDPYADAI